MSYIRNSTFNNNVGRRSSGSLYNHSRSDFLLNNKGCSPMPDTRYASQQKNKNVPFTRSFENGWSLSSDTPPQHYPTNYNYNNNRTSTSAMRGVPLSSVQPHINVPIQNASPGIPLAQISMGTPQGDNAGAAMPISGLEGNPNVKYVRLNWEDILGGKEGMKGMKVCMAPPAQGGDTNQNRQIQFSFGNQGENQQIQDGSVPLKVISFQPIENYPGQMTGQTQQGSALSQRPATPMPPRQSQMNGMQNYSRMNQEMSFKPKDSQTYMRQGQFSSNNSHCNCPACQFKQPTRR